MLDPSKTVKYHPNLAAFLHQAPWITMPMYSLDTALLLLDIGLPIIVNIKPQARSAALEHLDMEVPLF